MWTRTRQELPPEGKRVDTKIVDQYGSRNAKVLVRNGNVWTTPDGVKMFYTPTHWKPIIPQPE